jgi:Ni/Co efflux regulator RcnB
MKSKLNILSGIATAAVLSAAMLIATPRAAQAGDRDDYRPAQGEVHRDSNRYFGWFNHRDFDRDGSRTVCDRDRDDCRAVPYSNGYGAYQYFRAYPNNFFRR